ELPQQLEVDAAAGGARVADADVRRVQSEQREGGLLVGVPRGALPLEPRPGYEREGGAAERGPSHEQVFGRFVAEQSEVALALLRRPSRRQLLEGGEARSVGV